MGVFLVWYVFSGLNETELEKVKDSFRHANYWWVLLSIVFGALSHLSRAYRWQFLLDPLGYRPKFLNSFMAVAVTYLLNLAIPRSGEIGRATTLTKYEGVPFEKGFGTIVAERVADVLMLLLIIFIAFALQYDYFFNLISKAAPKNPIQLGGIIIAIIAFAYFGFKFLKKSSNKVIVKIRGFVSGLIEGVKSIFSMEKKWAFIFHTVFIWVMYVAMFYVVTFAIPETSDLSLGTIIVGFVAGAISIAITNGGIGTYPYGVSKAFALYGIAEVSGVAFGWIMWTAQTVMILILGALAFIFLPIYNRNKEVQVSEA